MKLVKIFGVVMAAHAAAFMFIFAIPGCRSTGKKPAATAPSLGEEASPIAAVEGVDSLNGAPTAPTSSSEAASVRFSPTRPGTAAAAEATAPTTYTVVKGDNLWSIAKKHNVTVKQLAAANKITTNTVLKLGQKLVLPSASSAPAAALTAPAPAVAAPSAPAATTATHTVKSGETLGVIAKRYGVKVGDIAAANNIADPTKLRVGQTLKVPGAKTSATAAKAPAPSKPVAPAAKPAAPAPEPAPAPALQPEAPVAPAEPASPVEAAPAVPGNGSPFITPATESSDAPIIPVQESGAPSF